jgi:hypothetical protein
VVCCRTPAALRDADGVEWGFQIHPPEVPLFLGQKTLLSEADWPVSLWWLVQARRLARPSAGHGGYQLGATAVAGGGGGWHVISTPAVHSMDGALAYGRDMWPLTPNAAFPNSNSVARRQLNW